MANTTEKKQKAGKDSKGGIDAKRFPKRPRARNQMPKGQHGGMKLMLIENVQHVGKQGDVVEVKPGYGRNFLIPNGLATYVTVEAQARIEKYKAKLEAIRIAKVNDLKRMAKELEKKSITIEANANPEGHLYGSVTARDISAAIQKENLAIDESHVRLEGAFKELGLYEVKIQLDEEVETNIKVWVVPMGGKPPA